MLLKDMLQTFGVQWSRAECRVEESVKGEVNRSLLDVVSDEIRYVEGDDILGIRVGQTGRQEVRGLYDIACFSVC